MNTANEGICKNNIDKTWVYVCHSVCAIFNHLYEIKRKWILRQDGPTSMVWHFLRTWEEQNRILNIGFNEFPAVTNVLLIHLLRAK